VECNENITCYTLIGVFQMLAAEGHACAGAKEACSFLRCFSSLEFSDGGRIAKRLVKNWWNVHDLPYCMRQIKEQNQVKLQYFLFMG
jgi:hypothetical protein